LIRAWKVLFGHASPFLVFFVHKIAASLFPGIAKGWTPMLTESSDMRGFPKAVLKDWAP
jgi:hypothetical protein